MKKWYVYLIQCCNGEIYCGITKHLKEGIALHNDGLACSYTRKRRPVFLLIAKYGFERKDAIFLENRIREMRKIDKIPFMETL
jgi:putative endonuclease